MAEIRRRMRLGFNWGEGEENFRKLTVSRADNHLWLTIPWNNEGSDPEDQHYVNPTTGAGGWSVLHGPCEYDMVAHVRLRYAQPACSTHVQIRHALESETTVPTWLGEAPEWPVLLLETSHTHLMGHWKGALAAGEVAQIAVDYWNAGHGLPQEDVFCWLAGATVDIDYWRPEVP